MTDAPSSAWSREDILGLFALPFNELLFQAHAVLRENWPEGTIHLSSLLSVKTGGCVEDCGYCAQSAKNKTGLPASSLLSREEVRAAARKAKASGSKRFCMSAAWRALKDRDIDQVAELVADVKSLGLETCLTLGMVSEDQARKLRKAGLDYYNHNVDSSPEYYAKVVTTRAYSDRLDTLNAVRQAGMKICSGGIVGMGEERVDRAGMLHTLASLDPQPESVPINLLVPIPGTPLENAPPLDPFELVRTIAVARILLPRAYVRLSAGRRGMSEETQALCFFAGANAVFYGEKLLTTDNQDQTDDLALFAKLGLRPEAGGHA